MSDEPPRAPVQYVLVRKDLDVWQQLVHVGHACGESIRVAPIDHRTILRVLHAESESQLLSYHARLVSKGFHAMLIVETDGPLEGQATALAVEPMTERISALRKIFWDLPKAGPEVAESTP